MKRKITAIALCAVMFATAIIGGTLAYFTDVDQNTNTFGAAALAIDLYETVGHKDGADVEKKVYNKEDKELTTLVDLGKGNDENPGVVFDHIMPGDTMTKVVTVENTEDYPTYVALTIKQEGYLNFNRNIDDYYENLPEYGVEKMQDITDAVFPGWNLLYDKTKVAASNAQVRYTMTQNPVNQEQGQDVEVLGVGYAQENVSMQGVPQYHYSGEYFTNGVGMTEVPAGEPDFFTISNNGAHDRVWIVYLKLDAGEKFTMDLTTVCPAYFDVNSAQAFDGMALDVQAGAIQVDGFATAKDAFAELLNTHNFAY